MRRIRRDDRDGLLRYFRFDLGGGFQGICFPSGLQEERERERRKEKEKIDEEFDIIQDDADLPVSCHVRNRQRFWGRTKRNAGEGDSTRLRSR